MLVSEIVIGLTVLTLLVIVIVIALIAVTSCKTSQKQKELQEFALIEELSLNEARIKCSDIINYDQLNVQTYPLTGVTFNAESLPNTLVEFFTRYGDVTICEHTKIGPSWLRLTEHANFVKIGFTPNLGDYGAQIDSDETIYLKTYDGLNDEFVPIDGSIFHFLISVYEGRMSR